MTSKWKEARQAEVDRLVAERLGGKLVPVRSLMEALGVSPGVWRHIAKSEAMPPEVRIGNKSYFRERDMPRIREVLDAFTRQASDAEVRQLASDYFGGRLIPRASIIRALGLTRGIWRGAREKGLLPEEVAINGISYLRERDLPGLARLFEAGKPKNTREKQCANT